MITISSWGIRIRNSSATALRKQSSNSSHMLFVAHYPSCWGWGHSFQVIGPVWTGSRRRGRLIIKQSPYQLTEHLTLYFRYLPWREIPWKNPARWCNPDLAVRSERIGSGGTVNRARSAVRRWVSSEDVSERGNPGVGCDAGVNEGVNANAGIGRHPAPVPGSWTYEPRYF
jgi:hypothetical protein